MRHPDLTEADHSLLGPLAEHRFLTLTQVAQLWRQTDAATASRVRELSQAGLIRKHEIFHGLPPAIAIAAPGLRAVGSSLRTPPAINLNQYAHEVGIGWLWLAARSGRFGELTQITTERRMRAEDPAAIAASGLPAWGIGLGLLNRAGTIRRHYPDLMLDTAAGHRIAVELELSRKSETTLRTIMSAYASDASVDHVLYLAGNARLANHIRETADRAGIADRVHVQVLRANGIDGAPGPARREPSRARATARPLQVRDANSGRER